MLLVSWAALQMRVYREEQHGTDSEAYFTCFKQYHAQIGTFLRSKSGTMFRMTALLRGQIYALEESLNDFSSLILWCLVKRLLGAFLDNNYCAANCTHAGKTVFTVGKEK